MKPELVLEKTLRKSFIFNILIICVKLISGIIGNSFALLADAVESASDVVASAIVWLGARWAARPADDNHPYGHGRAESLITFVVVLMLVLSSITIVYHSISNIQKPQQAPEKWTIGVVLLVIVAKESAYRFIYKITDQLNSTSGKSEAWHHRSDAITSLSTLIGVTIAVAAGGRWVIADEIAAMVAAGFILYNAYKLFRPALSEVLDEHVHHQLEDDIRKISKGVDGVLDTEKCHIRKAGLSYFVDLHAIVDGEISVREGHEIAHRLKDVLMNEIPSISNVLIHVEPYEVKKSQK